MRTPRNPKHKHPFTYKGRMETDNGIVNITYRDGGWLNGGAKTCDHRPFEEYDNSLYCNRGTDIIYICHQCHMFWHVDMSD